jgi:glycosyltransferase involved in cell wall biosynthesis
MSNTAAIFYHNDAYNTKGKRLLGRQAAGEGFLKGFIRHSKAKSIYCYTQSQGDFNEFSELIKPWLRHPKPIEWLPCDDPLSLAKAGTLYRPDIGFSQLAWQRRFYDQKAYSICGVTHTIASKEALEAIAQTIVAPVQPWDALICTSQAVKVGVDRLLENWTEYLAQRFGNKPEILVKLPIIPLGIDCNSFKGIAQDKNIRRQIRQQLNIPEGDIVVLFVGRLIFSAKAHPSPMYMALERAASQVNRQIHLLQAGWFEDERELKNFQQAAQTLSPSVHHIIADGRQPNIRTNVWAAGDIFISLADNIQETFGLTPIEAMASGLPVIVSDWNGYQESIRDEIDGFRIPTIMPPAEAGWDLAANYQIDSMNYATYVGHAAMSVAIDIDACTQALVKLIDNPQLRQKLGKNGQKRAREVYDWQVVIQAYEELWQELAEIRQTGTSSANKEPLQPFHPICEDPFAFFAHYPTTILQENTRLQLGKMGHPEGIQKITSIWMNTFGGGKRVSSQVFQAIIKDLEREGSLSVGEILNRYGGSDRAALWRSLVYLIKFDIFQYP